MDLLAIIRILVKNGQFSFDEYNEALARLEFSSYEKNDKPCQVPNTASLKVIKLKGKAIINWVHLRNWPLVVRMLIRNLDDPALALGLQLHEIVERLTVYEFYPYEIDVLEDRLTEYLVMRAIGLVKSILVKGIKVYQRHKSQRVDLQYFMCQRPNTEVFEFIEVAQLVDFKPLIMRGTINKFIFTLHHHVSHDYE